ncbi:MAG: hypothetical protein V3T22_10635, partial [Planctomycetota bacterium]
LATAMTGTATMASDLTGVGVLSTSMLGTATVVTDLTGVGVLATAMEGAATLSSTLDDASLALDFAGGVAYRWVQVFDATYTKVRCVARNNSGDTVRIAPDANSIVVRRLS